MIRPVVLKLKSAMSPLKIKLFLFRVRAWLLAWVLDPYFVFWAWLLRLRWRPRIILIIGSSGKTGLVNLLEHQLNGRVKTTQGVNTTCGVVFNLFDCQAPTEGRWRWLLLALTIPCKALYYRPQADIYLVEYDVYRPQNYFNAVRALKPAICLISHLSDAHSDRFRSLAKKRQIATLDLIIDQHFKVADQVTETVYLPADLATQYRQLVDKLQPSVKLIETKHKDYQPTLKQTIFKLDSGQFIVPGPQPKVIGRQLAFIAALAPILDFKIRYNLKDLPQAPGRSNYLKGQKGLKLIDSSYNSNPASLKAMLELLSDLPGKQKALVLGDMVELADREVFFHRQLAKWLAQVDCQQIIFLGRRCQTITYPLLIKLAPNKTINCFRQPMKLLEHLKIALKPQTVVLFKGSGFLEALIEQLLADPKDVNRLCRRQSSEARNRHNWLKKQL